MRLAKPLILLSCLVLLFSCAKDKEDKTEQEPPFTLAESVFYSPEEFAEAAYGKPRPGFMDNEALMKGMYGYVKVNNALLDGRMRLQEGSSVSWGYRQYLLHYPSVDVHGQPVTLSEIIIMPDGEDWSFHPEEVVLCNHYTIFGNHECPTYACGDVAAGVVSRGVAYICPDLEGYGITADRPHPFLVHDVIARQTVDGALAALDFLEQEGKAPSEDFRLYNIGYSQGGSYALATHRHIENNCTPEQQKRLHLAGTRCGGGPYAPKEAAGWYFSQVKVTYPCVATFLMNSMFCSFPSLFSAWQLEDFFSQAFLDSGLMEKTLSKQYTSEEIKDMMAAQGLTLLTDIFCSELFDTDSAKRKAVDAALERCSVLNGWLPEKPVILSHTVGDGFIPYSNAEMAAEALEDGNFQLKTVQVDENPLIDPHLVGAGLFYVDILMKGFEE